MIRIEGEFIFIDLEICFFVGEGHKMSEVWVRFFWVIKDPLFWHEILKFIWQMSLLEILAHYYLLK